MRLRRRSLRDPGSWGFSERAVLIGLLALGALVMLLVSASELRHLLVGGTPLDPAG